jgi:general secretion pathway protein D
MERFRGRIFLIALCLSLGASQLQAGDKPAGAEGGGALPSDATPVATGKPAKSDDSVRTTNTERVAATSSHSSEATDASAGGDDASADSSDSSASDDGGPAVAVNTDGSSSVSGTSRAVGDQDLITMNFQNVDLPVLAKFISEITGKNFVLDENVRGKVSIISPTKVTPEQAYSIFQSVLQVKGFTTIQAGAVIKIIPSRDVRESAELTQSQQPAITQGDQYVTRMIKLRNTDATSVMSVIQPMVSHDGLVAAFPQDNTLIITDDAYNVQRLLRIVGSLDVQGVQQNVAVIPLKLAFADDLAQQIEKIMSARENNMQGASRQFIRPGMGVVAPSAQGASTNFSVVPDERTNSLIVLASSLEMRQIKDLVQRLDIHSPNETARIHVYHLKYAPAGEMVDTLNGLLSGGGGPSSLSPTTGRNSLGRGGSGGMSNTGFGGGFGSGFGGGTSGYGSGSNSGAFSSFGGTNSSFGSGFGSSSMGSGYGGGSGSMGRGGGGTSGSMTASSGGGKNSNFENPVSVTADPATNSLVISAAPQDYETLRKVIEELDIPRVQVFVQAIIVEVSVGHSRDIGVGAFAPTFGNGSVLGVGTLNFGSLQNALGNPLGMTGLGIGLASGSNCSIPGTLINAAVTAATTTANTLNINNGTSSSSPITVPCEVALMTALDQDTHSNVLSAPTLLTADNEEATIVVGENLPFVGSATASSALAGQIFNSVDRQNVGISLDFIPQVTAGDYVRLDVYEEVSNVQNGTTNQATNPLGPTTTIRSASTSVLVQNHRTAVIGGLISSDVENTRSGVPFLSEIPVLGNLLGDTSRTANKDNLLVFLTPHVIRTRNDLQALALDERQKFVRSLGRKEVNTMPASQFQQLYQPSFNAPVSPQEDLMQSQRQGAGVPSSATGSPMSSVQQAAPSGSAGTP